MFKPSVIKVILCIIVIIGIITVVGVTGLYLPLNEGETKNNQIRKYDVTYRVALDDGDFPPLIVYNEDMEPTGFDIDLLHLIANTMEFNLIFVPTPWSNIFATLEAKEVDMIMSGASITPERLEKYLFSDPYLSISQSVAISSQGTMFMDDFYAGYGIVGVKTGTTSEGLVREILIDTGILPEENLKTYSDVEFGAQGLVNGEIHYLLSDWPVMVALIQRFPIHIIGDIDTGEKYGIVIHKDNKRLQKTINQGLEQLASSYELDRVKYKYLLDY